MASVAYPRPWNSGEMVYPTLITFGSPSATANPTSPTIPPPSRSSTVNWTQPPGSPGIRVLISTMSARTPAGSVRSHPCCRFTSGSLRYAEIVSASSGVERRARRGRGPGRDPPRPFGHHVRPGRQQADGIRGRIGLDDERPVEQRARQLEHLREDPRRTDPVDEGRRERHLDRCSCREGGGERRRGRALRRGPRRPPGG